jgi:putative SOS response-associated peptidase YedK
MFFAGLWDRWQSPIGKTLLSFTILTTAATGELAELHDRRPIIVPATHSA